MLLIRFDKWTRKTVNVHNHGFMQTINRHYINVIIFGFVWRAIEWDEYIIHLHED